MLLSDWLLRQQLDYNSSATTKTTAGDSAVNVFVCLFGSYLKLGADGRPSVLGAAFQRVLFVSAQYVFKQIVDKVQPDDTPEKPSEVAKTHDAAPHKLPGQLVQLRSLCGAATHCEKRSAAWNRHKDSR